MNCGSSSVKAALFDVDSTDTRRMKSLSHSVVTVDDCAAALDAVLTEIRSAPDGQVDAVGHRVVFGGSFSVAAIIDDEVLASIVDGQRLAPLHNRLSLEGIRSALEQFGGIPMVAVFDTAFHASLPDVARRYALPNEITVKQGLFRHGYHGIAHRSLAERFAELTATPIERLSLITLQLGSGCSATAIAEGHSIDTSMGLTPLEGLMMGKRPGDIDPGTLLYLLREGEMAVGELDAMLSERSGLLGVSGSSADMMTLLDEEAQGRPRAHAAIEMFCYRVRKYIGAYTAILGHVDAIVFGGGIGQHSPEIRRRICEPLEPLGLRIDHGRNSALTGEDGRFSADDSRIAAWAVSSDEERVIARDTFDVLAR